MLQNVSKQVQGITASHHSEPLAAMHSIAKNSQEYRSNSHPRNVTPDPIELLARCRLVGQCGKKVTSLLIFYSIILNHIIQKK